MTSDFENLNKPRKHQRGYWVLEHCAVCGSEIEIRQNPNKKRNVRKNCSPKCSNLWNYYRSQDYKNMVKRQSPKLYARRPPAEDKSMILVRTNERSRRHYQGLAKRKLITKSFLSHNLTK